MSGIKSVSIATGADIPKEFGPYIVAVKKTTVRIRDVKPEGETFQKSWGVLNATPADDVILIQDSGAESPCKKDIFAATYEETSTKGRYRKTEKNKIVLVPEGYLCKVETKEGPIEVPAGDYLAVGRKNEVWANKATWVADNLDIIGTESR
jgi:hypothetical protein